jgi:hypothetical protein
MTRRNSTQESGKINFRTAARLSEHVFVKKN